MLRVTLGTTAAEPGQVPSLLPERPLDPIHLVLAADARYGAWAGIALAAVLQANPGEALDIHVLSDGIARRDSAKLAALARGARAALSIHDVAPLLDAANGLAGSHHLSRAAYARLFIDRLLPREIERALYIDCDVLCCGAIRPLWQLGATVPLLAAACEQTDPAERKAALGIPAEGGYFNSGVMLINLAAWRAGAIGAGLLAFAEAAGTRLRWCDQDAISALLWREITELPARWNRQLNDRPRDAPAPDDAGFVHFNGRHKPWQRGYRGPAAALFRAAKRASPWKRRLPQPRRAAKLKRLVLGRA